MSSHLMGFASVPVFRSYDSFMFGCWPWAPASDYESVTSRCLDLFEFGMDFDGSWRVRERPSREYSMVAPSRGDLEHVWSEWPRREQLLRGWGSPWKKNSEIANILISKIM